MPYYVTTPDLLRERGAPPGPRVHHDRRRRARAAHAPARRGRLLPHGHRRARRAGRPGRRARWHHPARAGRPQRHPLQGPGRRARTSPTTSSSARPTPSTWRGRAEVVQRIHDNGHVYAGTYEGWYCPRCADFKTDSELVDGNRCPIHLIELEREKEDNWFFRLSTLPGAAREAVRRAARLRDAADPLQRGALVHQAGPAGRVAEPRAAQVGRAGAVGPERRSSTSGSTRSSTTTRRSPTRARARTSPSGSGPPTCT